MRRSNLALFLVAATTVFCNCRKPSDGSNIASKNSVRLTQNEQTVKDFFDLVTKGDIENAFKLVHADVEWIVPGSLPFSGTKTKEQYLKIVKQISAGFPSGFNIQVRDGGMVSHGNTVAAEVVSSGLHKNGKHYNNHYHFLIKFKGEQFIWVNEYMDTQHLAWLISPLPKPTFVGNVTEYKCLTLPTMGQQCFVGLDNKKALPKSAYKTVGILLDDDFSSLSTIRIGSEVEVKLSYTDEFDNNNIVKELANEFGSTFRYFQHAVWLDGDYNNIMVPRRD